MDSDPILSKRYQALFDEFNARYFHGRLPPYRIRVVEHIPDGELRTPTRMTKQFIENEATELLSDGRLNWTLRQFVRDLVSQGEVVAHSQAALLRQYPWVARVFSETKKRTRKEQEAREALRERFRAG